MTGAAKAKVGGRTSRRSHRGVRLDRVAEADARRFLRWCSGAKFVEDVFNGECGKWIAVYDHVITGPAMFFYVCGTAAH